MFRVLIGIVSLYDIYVLLESAVFYWCLWCSCVEHLHYLYGWNVGLCYCRPDVIIFCGHFDNVVGVLSDVYW